MAIEFNEGDYVLGVWSVNGPTRDWLCSVLKRSKGPDAGKWVLQYRFRYYEDDRLFDSNDKKAFYRGLVAGEASEDELIGACEKLATALRDEGFAPVIESAIVRTTSIEVVLGAMKKFSHLTTEVRQERESEPEALRRARGRRR